MTKASHRIDATFEGFRRTSIAAIERMKNAMDVRTLGKAALRLAEAETVYLVAQHGSYPVARHLAYALAKSEAGMIVAGSNFGADPEVLSSARLGDVVTVFSFQPHEILTTSSASPAARQGAQLIVVAHSPFSPLASHSDISFEVVEWSYRGLRSIVAAMTLSEALGGAAADIGRPCA